MLWEVLAEVKHAKGASKWAVTAYKDAQLVRLDPVSLSGVYFVNSIELVWEVLATLPFNNVPEMGRAHAAACFCYPLEHTISYLLKNFGRTVGKLAVADATAVKKAKILLGEFGLIWSANKTGLPAAMELTFAKTRHNKKISAVYNKLCEFTEAFAGQRLHLVVYLGFLFYFGMGASVENLDGLLLGINKARLALNGKKVPPGYNLVDHVIQDALILAGIYRFLAPPEKLLLHSHLTLLPFTSRREYFNKGVSTFQGVAVEVVHHLHCGVSTYQMSRFWGLEVLLLLSDIVLYVLIGDCMATVYSYQLGLGIWLRLGGVLRL
ncbi:hypothetical protein DSO57_1001812 [Entomophthora muscae]|uniref:Uncharacterized protein n=1 Tax=Entomophthora muscae TaxID=34485 RepID=A0ACC2U7D7_9FUNG|nr:hypothetical protein DSO57_1001812 [Entomophthora muscae]